MKNLILSFIILLNCINCANAYDTSSVKYCPFNVGNVYVYLFSGAGFGFFYKSRILKDSVINGKKYFYWLNITGTNPKFSNGWYRTDTITGSLYKFDSNSVNCYYREKLIDSLASLNGDTIRNCNAYTGITCIGVSNVNAFGISRLAKTFNQNNTTYNYIKYIGFFHFYAYFGNPAGNYAYTLTGCFVNGIVYGDTTITAIKPINKKFSERYSLSQNYPNPFNPTTIIKFQIKDSKLVTLKIYDILGKEIATLVNEKLKAGEYETTFDGSGLSSGIYFYTLSADGNRIDTKKMLMIK